MKNYSLIKINQSTYNWMIIATSYISPISVLDDVVKELQHASGHILFDLTLINGTESNRYITADIDNGVFIKTSFKTVSKISEDISKISRQFFVDNPGIVDGGVISNPLKYLLKEGIL